MEDELIVREMACDSLEMLGYTVHPCVNGSDAVFYFLEHHAEVDLAIIDLTMPEMNGAECFRKLKSIDPGIRVIITSGHTMDEQIDMLLQEGVRSFLQKPFDLNGLSDAVGRALD